VRVELRVLKKGGNRTKVGIVRGGPGGGDSERNVEYKPVRDKPEAAGWGREANDNVWVHVGNEGD